MDDPDDDDDDDDGVRPDVYEAMDKLYKSDNTQVRAALLLADQRGYTDFETFVTVAAALARQNQMLTEAFVKAHMAAPSKYLVVTQETFDALVSTGLANGITGEGN
jgi:hypothetical protein